MNDVVANDAVAWLGEHRKGEAAAELSASLGRVVQAVEEHGGKGVVTLKVEVTQFKKGALRVSAEVTEKLPKPEVMPALYYADGHGRLTRENPDQMQMFEGEE